ncbi:UNVERIFIED_CONTAM: hypothetical protein K2H54_070827 [Gekko kuhli]
MAETAMKMGYALRDNVKSLHAFETQTKERFLAVEIQEAPSIRHSLKPVASKLREANTRYRWLLTGKLQLSYRGSSYLTGNEEMGLEMLRTLHISDDPDLCYSQKRKLQIPESLEIINKVAVHNATELDSEDIADLEAAA